MYNDKKFNKLSFVNQTTNKISKLFYEYYDIGVWNVLLSHLSKLDHKLYKTYPICQFVGRIDDDEYLQYRFKACGTKNIWTFDIIKSYSAVLKKRTDNWVIPSAFDCWEHFDINSENHKEIPPGEYILRSGSYGDERTCIKWTSNQYSYATIRKLLERNIYRL